jgi:hypothetical protein
MVDKIWYDWQNKGPRNKYAFGGGSASALSNFTTFVTFPTGLPPYLGVSAQSIRKYTCVIMTLDALAFPPSV